MDINLTLCEKGDLDRVRNRNWIYELKLDGIRAYTHNGKLYNRNGKNITSNFPEIEVPSDLILDGELISTKGDLGNIAGRSTLEDDFRIELRSRDNPAKLVIFDILSDSNKDLRELPLLKRKKTLSEQGLEKYNGLEQIKHYKEVVPLWDSVVENGYEGIVAKNPDSQYVGKRTDEWLKVKNWSEGVFEVKEYELTENGGFVIKVPLEIGDLQKVVVNGSEDQKRIKRDFDSGLKAEIQYLELSKNNRLRKPSFKRLV